MTGFILNAHSVANGYRRRSGLRGVIGSAAERSVEPEIVAATGAANGAKNVMGLAGASSCRARGHCEHARVPISEATVTGCATQRTLQPVGQIASELAARRTPRRALT
jgi:hypothetical protein